MGFFVLMGGFHYYHTIEPLHPLEWYDVQGHVNEGTLALPTEDELKDRSKGDALAKIFVLGQTGWFVTQCLARWIQNIAVTELEVVIFLMYIARWNKPLVVAQPVAIYPFLEHKNREEIQTVANVSNHTLAAARFCPQWLQLVLEIFSGM